MRLLPGGGGLQSCDRSQQREDGVHVGRRRKRSTGTWNAGESPPPRGGAGAQGEVNCQVRWTLTWVCIIIFIIKDTHPSGRNGMLRSVSDRIESGRQCVGDRAGSGRLVFFLGNPSVVQTWAGRVDVSVQLLVGLIIVLHYKYRP